MYWKASRLHLSLKVVLSESIHIAVKVQDSSFRREDFESISCDKIIPFFIHQFKFRILPIWSSFIINALGKERIFRPKQQELQVHDTPSSGALPLLSIVCFPFRPAQVTIFPIFWHR